jgi:hypothetical protein
MWMPSGQVGRELEQCGGAGLPGADAELAETLGQPERADGLAGLAAGEQPGRGALVADGRVSAAGGGKLQDQRAERFGEHDGLAPEPEAYLAVTGIEMAKGELADRGWPLGVEQDKQASDAVLGFERAVVQQPACLVPSVSRCR